MTRALIIGGSLFILLIAGLLIGPGFVNWNNYKDQIIAQVKEKAGYDISIDGDLSLSLLPYPNFEIQSLTVLAPKPKVHKALLSMKEAQVSVNVAALLTGQISIDTIRLVNPDIRIEILPNGTPSWLSEVLSGNQSGGEASSSKENNDPSQTIAFDSIKIENGRFEYTDHRSGQVSLVSDINTVLQAKSLQGPFKGSGRFEFQKEVIGFDIDTGSIKNFESEFDLSAVVSLPEKGTSLTFAGVIAGGPSPEIQGETTLKLNNPSALFAAMPSDAFMLQGLVTASNDKVSIDSLSGALGETKAKGRLSISGLQERDPVLVAGDLNLNGLLDLSKTGNKSSVGAKSDASSTQKTTFFPENLTLPMPIDLALKINSDGFIYNAQTIKGVVAEIKKTGPSTTVSGKLLELPGQGRVEGKIDARYKSASTSEKNGSLTYADPVVTYVVDGRIGNIGGFADGFAPNVKQSIPFQTAQFDLKGSVTPSSVSLKDSVLKLDQSTIGLSGQYAPGKASIDVSTDTLNLDALMPKSGQEQKTTAKSGQSLSETLKPVQAFRFPMDISFDLSAQNLVYNGETIKGVRVKGRGQGASLTLDSASIEDIYGSEFRTKGQIANLNALSGIDMTVFAKTSDIRQTLSTLQMDTASVPAAIKTAEGNVSLKGNTEKLAFDSNVKVLGGTAKASGDALSVLNNPKVNSVKLSVSHPNLARAIKSFSPSFEGGSGLGKTLNLSANVSETSQGYTISDLKASVGPTSLSGSLKVSTAAQKPSVSGSVALGTVPLDSLLGHKAAMAAKSGKSSGAKGSARWTKTPVQVAWLDSMDMALDVSAKAVNYGGWQFQNPKTSITMKNGTLSLSGVKAGLFGGNVNLDATLAKTGKNALSIASKSTMSDIAVEPLAYALSNSKKLKAQGKVGLNVDIKTAGTSQHALINALSGTAGLNGRNIVLEGVDLGKIARGLSEDIKIGSSVQSILGGAISGGQTEFTTVEGQYTIEKGIVRISSMSLDGPEATITPKGTVNLPQYTIDTTHTISLKNAGDFEPFTITIKGPLDNPANTFGRGIFEDYLKRKIQRKIGKELPGLVGGDVGDALQKFGLGDALGGGAAPQKQEPAAGDNTQQKQQQQQKAPLEQLLENPDDPEKAIRGVLDGLLR